MPESVPIRLPWPIHGLDENWGYAQQREGTTPKCQNVRGIDPSTGRTRGAQREGHTKYLSGQHSANPVQDIGHVVVSAAVSGASDASVRDLYPYVVCGGTVSLFSSSAFTTATNGSGALASGVPAIYSAVLFGNAFFADGTNAKYWTASTNTVSSITATAGTFPSNGSNYPRLVVMWRSRLVWSGLVGDAHNWFMSAVGNGFDYDYDPEVICETQAVAGNNSDAGLVGDVVNTMIPFNDDILLFGCDHSIWQMTGDPASGGRIDRISDVTGMSFGMPWCKDPAGIVYFWGSRGGLYRMAPSSLPVKISSPTIDRRLADINLSSHLVRMAYDERRNGVRIYITPTASASTTNYFYDTKNDAWWPDVFATNSHNPLAVHVLDGDAPGDRVVLLGTKDGYLLKVDDSATNDDSTAIDSYVVFPLIPGPMREGMVTEMQATLGASSSNVAWSLFAEESVEDVFNATIPRHTGTWVAGRNSSSRKRARGDALYLKVGNSTASQRWQFEHIDVLVRETGRVSQRAV